MVIDFIIKTGPFGKELWAQNSKARKWLGNNDFFASLDPQDIRDKIKAANDSGFIVAGSEAPHV